MNDTMVAVLDDDAVILVVEDDMDDITLLKRAFSTCLQNFKLDVAHNGQDALEHLMKTSDRSNLPDLIILDLNMPVMNGFELLSAIRESDKLKHLPVIVLTTTNDDLLLERAYLAGANSVIQKGRLFEAAPDLVNTMMQYWFQLAHIPKK